MNEITVSIPEDLARELVDASWSSDLFKGLSRAVAAALPKPKPSEPTGLGAVVRATEDREYVLADPSEDRYRWYSVQDGSWAGWEDLDIRSEDDILSHGVEDA